MSSIALLNDPAAFRTFEHEGWQAIAEEYDDHFGRLTRQLAGSLLDAVGARRGLRLLDVATGPGYVAAEAAERGAQVSAVDFSAAMVARARRKFPELDLHEGDACALPFADGCFDAVTMSYGLLHLAEPERALSEAWRVLRDGGRFAFSVWAGPEQARGLGILLEAVRAHGDPEVALPPGPPPFRFSEAAECERTLRAAGFQAMRVRTVHQLWRIPTAEALFDVLWRSTVRMAGVLRAQPAEALPAIRSALTAAAAGYRDGHEVALPMPAILASAVKEPRG